MGVDLNGDKALLAIDDASAESEESWAGVFESLRERGLKDVALLVADGAAGIWSAFSKAYPRAKQQRLYVRIKADGRPVQRRVRARPAVCGRHRYMP